MTTEQTSQVESAEPVEQVEAPKKVKVKAEPKKQTGLFFVCNVIHNGVTFVKGEELPAKFEKDIELLLQNNLVEKG